MPFHETRMCSGALSLALLLGSVNAALLRLRRLRPRRADLTGSADTPPPRCGPPRAAGASAGELALDPGRPCTAAGWTRRSTRWTSRAGAIKLVHPGRGIVAGGVLGLGRHRVRGEHPAEGRVYTFDRAQRAAVLAQVNRLSLLAARAGRTECSWSRTSGESSWGWIPLTGPTRWRRHTGGPHRAIPAGLGGDPDDADSLFRHSPPGTARSGGGFTTPGPWSRRGSRPRSSSWPGRRIPWCWRSIPTAAPPMEGRLDAPVMDSPRGPGRYRVRGDRRGTPLPGLPADSARAPADRGARLAGDRSGHHRGRPILLGGADGTIRALEPGGTERWRVTLWRPVEVGPLALDDGLVAAGGRGDLHRYRR